MTKFRGGNWLSVYKPQPDRPRKTKKPEVKLTQRGPPDFSTLPVTIERQRLSKAQRTGLLIGGIAVLVSALLYGRDIMEYFDVGAWLINVGAIVMFFLVAGAAYTFLPGDQETITIGQSSVTVKRKGKFGNADWTVPVNEFSSICWQNVRTGKGVGYMVELLHPDPTKNVVLYSSYSDWTISSLCEKAAKALNLPVERSVTIRSDDDIHPVERGKTKRTEDDFIFYWRCDQGGEGGGDGDGDGNGGGE